MPLQFDPEFFKVFEPLIPLLEKRPKLTLPEIPASREGRNAGISAFMSRVPESPGVEQTIYQVEATDGYQISIYGFTKKDAPSGPGPAILHFHGGGMTVGSAQIYARPIAKLVSETSIPIFSVNYRLAPEANGTTLVEDCYAALAWLHQNAESHNINPARIAVFGESAGGGLAAGVALIARDRNLQPRLAKQILVYPMIEDRNMTVNKAIEPFAFYKTEDKILSWTAVLGADKAGRPDADVSEYAVPARARSLAGLPPAYIEVGEFDIFRDEDIAYATRLLAENVTVEFHLYPGLPHGFDMIAPSITQSKRAYDNRLRAMLSF
jgi:acetyl esterase/lipase